MALEALAVADQAHWSHRHPCRSVPAGRWQLMGLRLALAPEEALMVPWKPNLWVHAAWALLDPLVDLAAAMAAVALLAPQLAAVVVVEPISIPLKCCVMAAVDHRHHLERGPW